MYSGTLTIFRAQKVASMYNLSLSIKKIIKQTEAKKHFQAAIFRQMCKCPSSFPVCWFSWPKVTFLGLRFYPKAARYFSGKQSRLRDLHEPHIPPQTKADASQRGFSTMCKLSIKYTNRQRSLKERALSEESGGNHSAVSSSQYFLVMSCQEL